MPLETRDAFQFHTGSIKSRKRKIPMGNGIITFQFHTGSIKRIPSTLPLSIRKLCFNSILVRLKVDILNNVRVSIFCFNSILVRLKATCGERPARFIKTRFNSILVRLKVRIGQALARFYGGFNSILVRLKARLAELREIASQVSIPYWFD